MPRPKPLQSDPVTDSSNTSGGGVQPPPRNRRKPRRCFLAVAAVLFLAAASWLCIGITTPNPPAYKGKALSYWIQQSITGNDPDADGVILSIIADQGPAEKARTGRNLRASAESALKAKDSKWWKPYTSLRARAPSIIARFLPTWREPSKRREAAAAWVYIRSGSAESPAAVLDVVKRNDSEVLRRMLSWAIDSYGIVTPADFPLMLAALTNSSSQIRRPAVKWFGMARLCPETVVPILLKGLQDDAMRSDYAATLRAYGAEARFAVPSLLALANTNNPATASVAAWALAGIDPDGAGKPFLVREKR